MAQQQDDDLRSFILDAGKRTLPEIVEVCGKRYEVRPPTSVQYDEASLEAGISADQKTGEVKVRSPRKMNIALAISCTFNPDTKARLFKAGDFAALCDLPAGSVVEQLGAKASELANQEVALGKPSAPSQAESSSDASPAKLASVA